MKHMIRQVPVPIAGVMLGLAALGNLLQSYSEVVRLLCGAAAAFLGIFLLLKFVLHPDQIKKDYESPVIAGVSATIFMSLMQLSTYAYPFIGNAAFFVWVFAVSAHLILILWYTAKFLFRFRLKEIYPTCFITYVGIIVAPVTAPTFHMEKAGMLLFYLGFGAYFIMFTLITIRYFKHEVEEPSKPLFCIYTAPMSLSLAGYLTSFDDKSLIFTLILEIAAQILYVVVLTKLPKLLRLPFYPSFAAFTFPFVITAFALKKWIYYLEGLGVAVPEALHLLLFAETVIAVLMVGYVFIRYIMYLSGHLKTGLALKKAEAR